MPSTLLSFQPTQVHIHLLHAMPSTLLSFQPTQVHIHLLHAMPSTLLSFQPTQVHIHLLHAMPSTLLSFQRTQVHIHLLHAMFTCSTNAVHSSCLISRAHSFYRGIPRNLGFTAGFEPRNLPRNSSFFFPAEFVFFRGI